MSETIRKSVKKLKRIIWDFLFYLRPTVDVSTSIGVLKMSALTPQSRSRALGMITTEPDTIEWLEKLKPGQVFFDVGCNVGVFSIYAASLGAKVFAFDPVPSNVMAVASSALLNGLEGRIFATPIAILDRNSLIQFGHSLGNVSAGHKVLTGHKYTEKQRLDSIGGGGRSLAITLDKLVTDFGFPLPHFVKIDVDGPELDVLNGAKIILSDPVCISVMIEASEKDGMLQKIKDIMGSFDFELIESHLTEPSQVHEVIPNLNNFFWRKSARLA